MSEGIKVASIDDVEEGEAIVVEPEESGFEAKIAVFHSDNDEWYALDDTCTHADASLADGWIEGEEVECPMHTARFCLRTGKVLCMPATEDMRTHKVEVRGEDVYLFPGTPAEGD
ncbi:3-phenylpropionate/trans-cinnamate dioxygenase ferredoxin subunit [Bowdeniella nasicola]|uniref:3-phenylpropionate/trans-cinnamate dioxygenase ferredoxin subunit n=1 Tax=Bowdeniella nasicola TaxID=208480 RepID=A0A1H4CMS0_9ACTO|nr:bifunctional 3-phenylpropionate/cinnamic acid dioxygenase ferredoxin subunit [Bowdeniella nasicola]SEA61620.1 3-phenylpropionate/trans-cinnamate dioxygenase ferredoxin subunit [Bowdeniella nasicola]